MYGGGGPEDIGIQSPLEMASEGGDIDDGQCSYDSSSRAAAYLSRMWSMWSM